MLWCDINVLRCIERKKCVFVDLYIIYVLEYIMRCGFDKIVIRMYIIMIVISSLYKFID